MNDLYEAVMILGDSVKDVERYGWTCGVFDEGGSKTPKCVNGVLSVVAGSESADWIHASQISDKHGALRICAIALIDNAPEHIVEHLVGSREWRNRSHDDKPLNELADLLIQINDAHIDTGFLDGRGEEIQIKLLTQDIAIQWFRHSFNELSRDLPEPLPIEEPLTVERILATEQPVGAVV